MKKNLLAFALVAVTVTVHAADKKESAPLPQLSKECEQYKTFWAAREMDPTFEFPKKCVTELKAIDAATPKKKSRVGEKVTL